MGLKTLRSYEVLVSADNGPYNDRGEASSGWSAMRTVAMLRRERNLPIPVKQDSVYRPVHRETRRFHSLKIPKKLQAELPFASKPKIEKRSSAATKAAAKKRAVVLSPHERKVYTLLQQLSTVRNDKKAKRREKAMEKSAAHRRKAEKLEEKFQEYNRAEKKRKFRKEGLDRRAKERRMR